MVRLRFTLSLQASNCVASAERSSGGVFVEQQHGAADDS